MALPSSTCSDSRLRRELKLSKPVGAGKSKGARLVQEYLTLNGFNLVIDGDFGVATTAAVADFCRKQKIPVATSVDQALMDLLAQPLLRAVDPVAKGQTLGDTIVAVAKRHVDEHPIEVGGPNGGPWVRLYMDGHEGPPWLWCAGFVTYIVKAAAVSFGVKSPVKRTYSCDVLAMDAKNRNVFHHRRTLPAAPPGSIFVIPNGGNAYDWIHTGLIVGTDDGVFRTIEGNTNDEGTHEGFEACERYRARKNVDVILI